MKNTALTVSGIIFLLVAILHAARLIMHIDVTAGGSVLPMSSSIFGFLFGTLMALWMFASAKGKP
jgi:hypothetical protein